MKEFEIKFNDIHRILIGEVPYHFYIEVIFKVAIIYLILMVSMRFMGKRMATQLGRNEMAAVTSLAAAIGVPLMNPDRGLLPAVIIAAVLITYQTLIARKASTNKKFESLTQDKYNMLVKDGVLNTKAMMLTRVSRDRVFAQLRSESVSHTGEVKRLYFEAAGGFSLLAAENPKPGLSILPEWDTEISAILHKPIEEQICGYCGYHQLKPVVEGKSCSNCQHNEWVKAVSSVE
jgi:uncharacterized membrane protein YcaP (DUF421 family)